MKAIFGIALVAMLVSVAGCEKKQATPPATNSAPADTNAQAETEKKQTSGNPITAPVDYLGAVGQAQQTAIKQIDLAYVNQAIQQFNAAEGRFPKDLDELISTHYLTKLPAAPYGKKIQYDVAQGKVSVVKK